MDINLIMKELHLMQQSYASLFSVVNKVQTRGDEYLEALTSRQHMALIAIAHLPIESTTLSNIAKKLGTTKQTANKLITSLTKKGYVQTVPSKVDKRSINIEITSEGNRALIACAEASTYFLADMFHEFTTEEIETFWRLLQKLYRFDGEEQDGLEKEAHLEVEEQAQFISDSYKEKILTEFSRRRYGSENNE